MTDRMPMSRMESSSSAAPGRGWNRSSSGIAMARRMRAIVVALGGRPARSRLRPMRSSAVACARRQGVHGRGGRQKIETDVARIVSGVRGGYTIGSPVTLVLENKDHVNWIAQMTPAKEGFEPKPVTRLRPGHADLAGALKYGHTDIRNVLERSSARETATRVAAGGVARKLLGHFGIAVLSFTQSIGTVDIGFEGIDPDILDVEDIEASPVRCPDPDASKRMVAAIDEVAEQGDTLGGTFRIVARGVPPGLGSYVHWDRKLDGKLAQAVMSINAIKGVEFGAGFQD